MSTKRLTKACLSLCVVLLLVMGSVIFGSVEGIESTNDEYFAGGDGSEDHPFQIENWYHLDNVRKYAWEEGDHFEPEEHVHFELVENLDKNSEGYEEVHDDELGFEPLSNEFERFYGSFYGNGNEIADLYIYEVGMDYTSLFGVVDGDDGRSEIKDLGLVDVDVTGRDGVGTLMGGNWGGTVSNTFATGTVEGKWGIGGLLSENGQHPGDGSVVEYSYASVETTSVAGYVGVAGLAAANNGTLRNSYSTGDVYGYCEDSWIGDASGAGGLVGENRGYIENSYSTSDVWGDGDGVGGLISNHLDGVVSNSYAAGDVEGDEAFLGGYIGGLIGIMGEPPILLSEDTSTCESSTSVDPQTQSSFWDMDTTGQEDGVGDVSDGDGSGVIGESTEKMKEMETFTSRGWDFDETWGIDEEINDGYPYLRWQLEEYYELTVNIDGEGTVEVDPDQEEYEGGTEVSLTAVPDDGWEFVEWTGDYESEEEEITMTMDQHKEIPARFVEGEIEYYGLTVNIEGEGEVEIDPDLEEYEEGTEVDLTALPVDGWTFVEWTGDRESTEEEITMIMNEDKEVTAWFEELEEFNLTGNIEGEGIIEVDGDEVEDGRSEYYHEGTVVELSSISAEGWYFVGWTGDHESGSSEIELTMDEDKDVTAHFEEIEDDRYVLTVEVQGEGITEPEPGDHLYDEGEEVTVEAIPDDGSLFQGWTGDYQGTEEEITMIMDEDKTVRAHFLKLHELTVEEPDGSGEILVEGEPIETWPYTGEFEEGDDVVLEAVPEEDWVFSRWELNGESEEYLEMTVNMDRDKVISAYFLELYRLTTAVEGEGMIEIDPNEERYQEGTEVELTAVPEEGWLFVEWTGDYTDTEGSIKIVVDSDIEVTAHFEEQKEYHDLTVNMEGEGDVNIVPDQEEYEEGTEVTLTAEPREGWRFVGWSGDHESEDTEITVTLTDEMDIRADFERVQEDGSDDEEEEERSLMESDMWIVLIAAVLIVIGIAVAIFITKKDDKDRSKKKTLFSEVGKNIGFGTGMFGTLGLSLFILGTLMDSGEEIIIIIFLFVAMMLTPLISLFLGVFQGKASSNSRRAVMAGSLTGLIGLFLIMLSIFALVMVTLEGGNDTDDLIGPQLIIGFAIASIVAGGGGGYLGQYFYCENSTDEPERKVVEEKSGQNPEPEMSSVCPDCGRDLKYIEEYQRWYCYKCKEYR